MAEQFVTTPDGARLWTFVEGRGPAMVLCHGGPGSWDYLGPLSSLVTGAARVVRWDQRGCGRSGGAGPHTVARSVEDLEVIRRAYRFDRWIVAGHSWGASLALFYALEHPARTEALVYVSGTGIGQRWNRPYHEEADRRRSPDQRARLDSLGNRPRRPAEEHEYRMLSWAPDFADRRNALELAAAMDAPFAINYQANRQLNAEVKGWIETDLIERCRQLATPALLLHGEEDPRPAWAIESLAGALPNACVEVLPRVGHVPWLEAPAATAGWVRSFLSALA